MQISGCQVSILTCLIVYGTIPLAKLFVRAIYKRHLWREHMTTTDTSADSLYPQPFEYGKPALINSKEILEAQLTSFFLFVIVQGAVLGGGLFVVGAPPIALLIAPPLSLISWVLAFFASIVAGWIICLIGAMHTVPASSNGVPRLLDSRVSWWLMPPGVSWWFIEPIGSIDMTADTVHVGELTIPFTLQDVEAADNAKMSTEFRLRCRCMDPLVFVRHDVTAGVQSQAASALGSLMVRTMRWYVSGRLSTELPRARGEASKILSGVQGTFIPHDADGADMPRVTFATKDETADGRTVREIARDLSFEIIEVLVESFDLPPSISDAAEKARIEEAQRRAEATEMETVIQLMQEFKDQFPGLSDAEALRAVQTERGKIMSHYVGGDAGDFTKGAAIGIDGAPD